MALVLKADHAPVQNSATGFHISSNIPSHRAVPSYRPYHRRALSQRSSHQIASSVAFKGIAATDCAATGPQGKIASSRVQWTM
jgi:hypothetical protein